MNILVDSYAAINFFTSFSGLVLALISLSQYRNRFINRIFALMCILISSWTFGLGFHALSMGEASALFWSRFLHASCLFIPAVYFNFISELMNRKRKFEILFVYLISAIIFPFVFTKIFISSVLPISIFHYFPKAGPIYFLYIALWISVIMYSLLLMIEYILKNKGIDQERVKYVLAASIIGYGGAATTFFPMYGINVFPFANFMTIFYTAVFAYAFLNTRLMDIDVIIRKGAVILSVTLIFSLIYLSLIFASQFIFESLFGRGYSFWMVFPAVFIISLFFKPISDAIQYYVIKIFFRRKFAADMIAARFSDSLKELMEIDKIGDYITRSAVRVFRVKGSACFILDKKEGDFKCVSARGDMKHLKDSVELQNILIMEIQSSHKAVVKDELMQLSRNNEGSEKQKALELISVMDRLGCAICVPSFISKGKAGLVGFLLGSEREKEYLFSNEDIDLLENFASQAAVSINNAFMYQARLEEIERSMEGSKFADIGATAAGVAHEAKNALGSVHAFAQLLQIKKPEKKFLEEHVDMVSNEVERMRVLMEGVVDYSGGDAVEKKYEDIKEIISETIVLVRDQAHSKDIKIDADLAGEARVNVNKNSMKQVFLNLFINAIDAMERGGKLMVYALESDNKIIVRVADTGCGIPENKLEKIFEPFFSTKPQGTGLGLAIIKKAVTANGGTITVKSEVGTGTVFELVFKKN